ncbi:kelch-like protein 28 [Fagus crenata]
MGAGRKTETHTLKEKSQAQWTTNCSSPARNLRKSDLGGVIFGCKNHTFGECYSKRLFGLPAPHFSYVQNVSIGLPLFLFNYSDRKLHGIFEAASPGQLNIDPYGWTDGSVYTSFPAQVKIRIRMQCQPLPETQFSHVIEENYYEERLFWFELDREQTNKLISLFSSSQVIASTFVPRKTPKWSIPSNNPQKWSGLFKSVQEGGSIETPALESNAHPEQASLDLESWEALAERDEEKGDCGQSYAPVQQKKWSALFEDSNTYTAGKVQEGGRVNAPMGEEVVEKDEETENEVASKIDYNEHLRFMTKEMSSEHNQGEDTGLNVKASNDIYIPEASMTLEMKSSELQSIVAELLQEVSELKFSQLKQDQKINSLELDLVESRREFQCLKDRFKVLERGSFPENGVVTEEEFESCDGSHSDLDEKVLIVGGYDGSFWLSTLDCYSPSCDLKESLSPMNFVRSHASAAKLKGEVYLFGGVNDKIWYDTVESYNPISNQWVTRPSLNETKGSLAGVSLNEKIFAIGGENGVECFSKVDVFDLEEGRWIPTQSMLHKRFSTAAAEINGTIYVAGGYDGTEYLNSVERFDPREHSWTRLENMSKKRGRHSLTVLNEKLYAIGGYDGDRIVSSVEVFDPRVGSWVMEEPLNDTREYAGVVTIGDSIYVIGGRNDNRKTLDTVERYKEGHGWQLTNRKAVKRCCFSAIVL